MSRSRRSYRYNKGLVIIYKVFKLLCIITFWICVKSYKLCKWIYFKLKYKEQYYTEEKLKNILRQISPRQFEVFCCELYKALGYTAKITAATHDGGVDVILRRFGTTIYVECKHYADHNMVGREICQKLLGSCVMNKADRAIVFTTGGIHKNARECERMVNHLDIVDFKEIYKLFNGLSEGKRNTIISSTMAYL